jgi:predicted regulator of Ras-like GTPase activity (Roadblock/LC7/MglB family)
MATQGNLAEMSLANLIQVNCQEVRSARLTLTRLNQIGEVYFSDGQVVHAALDGQIGETALYELLAWSDGTFTLDREAHTSEQTIARPWGELLLEGMKQLPTRATKRKEVNVDRDALTKLRAIENVTGAVISACDGIVLAADVPGSDGEAEAAVAVFLGSAAGQLSDALQLESFAHGLVVLKNKRLLILEQPNRFIGLVLAEHASPTIVASAATDILKKTLSA